MKNRPFKQVDVFTATPYLGNPLAVVLDAGGLSTGAMQQFAHWTNLSETTFLLPPSPEAAAAGADYQVRIFTTAYEMPFAGHPTLGSCHAWLESGGQPKHPEWVMQECQVGLVRIRHHNKPLAFAAPPLTRSSPTAECVAQLSAALGLSSVQLLIAQHLVNGPRYIGLLLSSTNAVLQLQPDLTALRPAMVAAGLIGVGVAAVTDTAPANALIRRSNREARAFGSYSTANSIAEKELAQLEVRFFANDVMVTEDPVTGSFNASLAQWLIADGLAPSRYVATQGTCLGRYGQVHIERDGADQVWVGGACVSCIDGVVKL